MAKRKRIPMWYRYAPRAGEVEAKVLAEQLELGAPPATEVARDKEPREWIPPDYRDLLGLIVPRSPDLARRFFNHVRSDGFAVAALTALAATSDQRALGEEPDLRLEFPDDRVRELVLDSIRAADAKARAAAVRCLTRLDMFAAVAVPMLREALADGAEMVRWRAALELGRVAPDSPGLATVLLETAGKDFWFDDPYRGDFIPPVYQGLCEVDDEGWEGLGPETVPGLYEVMSYRYEGWHPSPVVCCQAAVALGASGYFLPYALDELEQLALYPPYFSVGARARRGAATLLAGLRDGTIVARSEDDRFLLTIREHPNDDHLRLVYADWLDDRDDIRGAFVRFCCAWYRERNDGPERADELADRSIELRRLVRAAGHSRWATCFERLMPWEPSNAPEPDHRSE